MELSVIIVNYNGLKYLNNCFESLFKKLNGISFEIIIIDNNSSDESCKFIIDNFPNIILVQSKTNYGFGKGNNEAVKIAKGDYLLLLNNDTIILDDLFPALEILKSDSKIGVIGINMLDSKKEYLQAVGNFPNPINMFKLKNLLNIGKEFESGNFSKERYDVDWLGGSFLLLSKKLYSEIGGFDEDYFMYVEDVDFCKKIADRGYKRVFLSKFNYIHYIGFNDTKNKLLIKGYEIYLSKHSKGIEKALCYLSIKANKTVKKIKNILK